MLSPCLGPIHHSQLVLLLAEVCEVISNFAGRWALETLVHVRGDRDADLELILN